MVLIATCRSYTILIIISDISHRNTEILENDVRNHEALSKVRGQGKSNIINMGFKLYVHFNSFTHAITFPAITQ
jgi:hypothetical protein